ncbi:NTP transferase domain-containing protein [Pseudoalteromonas sp. DL2-H2.2]|uniref:nucleotidyltransferase family protein n=1 Tax=Pseudoalteromonas sp. DL2-H2.2 TaxID=2908889 RepID=UPI001F2506C5|nr:NTP transferase domain-containing protein [Pseudoalteromonas sp. DL2-H2.2]MCF2908397.1 NTP transferase domain-containing protein [Pseudoalteromonas sp. DL2-H2.2]
MYTGKEPTLVILAAGLGKRFGGNKQIAVLPDFNCTIMELSIQDAYAVGVRHLVLVINRQVRPLIEQQILPRLPADLQVELVEQAVDNLPSRFASKALSREKPWGTGHALLCAKPFIPGDAIVITADDYYGPDAYKQLVNHFAAADQGDMAIVGYPLAQTLSSQGGVNRGICQTHKDSLLEVIEYLDIHRNGDTLSGFAPDGKRVALPETALASMTCWGITQTLLTQLEYGFSEFLENYDSDVKSEYYLPDCIQSCIQQGLIRVRVHSASERWFGITYKEELKSVSGLLYELRHG